MIARLSGSIDAATVERLVDPQAFVIVLGGTLLATLAHCGWRGTMAAIAAAFGLLTRKINPSANRAALARAVSEFVRRGYLCADLPPPPDPPIAAALDAYRRSGSPISIRQHAEQARADRAEARDHAVRPLEQAGDMAPIFGLVGTLLAITELAATGTSDNPQATTDAIGTAVLSTLYGVVAANLFFVPLARAIERRGRGEDIARTELIEWAATHLEKARNNDVVSSRRSRAALLEQDAA